MSSVQDRPYTVIKSIDCAKGIKGGPICKPELTMKQTADGTLFFLYIPSRNKKFDPIIDGGISDNELMTLEQYKSIVYDNGILKHQVVIPYNSMNKYPEWCNKVDVLSCDKECYF